MQITVIVYIFNCTQQITIYITYFCNMKALPCTSLFKIFETRGSQRYIFRMFTLYIYMAFQI